MKKKKQNCPMNEGIQCSICFKIIIIESSSNMSMETCSLCLKANAIRNERSQARTGQKIAVDKMLELSGKFLKPL